MDISLKCLGFTLLMIKYLCVSLTLKQPGWARFEGNAPSHPSKHYSKLTHIGEYYFALSIALSCITPPYLHHPSPVYYRGWPHISVECVSVSSQAEAGGIPTFFCLSSCGFESCTGGFLFCWEHLALTLQLVLMVDHSGDALQSLRFTGNRCFNEFQIFTNTLLCNRGQWEINSL